MRVAGGVNLAVAWGFGLIVLAFVVALAALRLPEER
jgi:anaerobic C4-dicarboxylate transporter